jgi:hypothetical protein
MASFKIGREFFAKAKADYADWRWAWVREISQKQHGIGDLREMSESLQNFRFQLRSPTGGDVTVWQQGYGLDNAKWRVLQQYKGWVIQRVWPA